MEQRLLDWLASYRPGVLFCAQMFGIFGLPIPDELLMTVAGALAREGRLGMPSTILAAIAGCTCGITLSYVVGRTVGVTAVRRIVHVPEASFARAERWFHRFGGLLLTFGYFIPGVRHCTAIAAGSTPVGYGTFARFAYPGAVLWCLVFVLLGYYAGSQWRAVLAMAQRNALFVMVPLVILAALGFWVQWRRATGSNDTGTPNT